MLGLGSHRTPESVTRSQVATWAQSCGVIWAMFSELRIAQMAAFFVAKERDRRQATLKLMKLLYLADRESLNRFGHPISFDVLGSMNQGPVLSGALDLIHGEAWPSADGWAKWISDENNYEVSVRENPNRERLTELSDADLAVMESVWQTFGHMDRWQIRDYTHQNCREWEFPDGGFTRIDYRDILAALGKGEHADELVDDLRKATSLQRILARR